MKKELKKFPKKTKFNKNRRGTLNLINFKKIKSKNIIIIKTISAGFINWKIFNETIKNIKRIFKKKKNKMKFFINVSLNWPISRKPKGTRMGKGKGKVNFDYWYARVKASTVLFKITGIKKKSLEKNKKTILNILPIPCSIS